MSETLSSGTLRTLYEISLSIEPRETLEATVESAISTYAQQLDSSAVAVFERTGTETGRGAYDLLTATPDSATTDDAVLDAATVLSDDADISFPHVDTIAGDRHRYVMQLPEFGALVLITPDNSLNQGDLTALSEVNEKLATACNWIVTHKQYEAQYRELFTEAPVMFALTEHRNGEPFIIDCNDAFVETLGYERATITDRRLADFYTEECENRLLAGGYEKAMRGEFGTEERVFRTRRGEKITTILRATPRRNTKGAVVGTNCIYVDVTELKRRNQQLSVLHRVLRHNLRNELTAIKGSLSLARKRASEDAVPHLDTVADQTDALEETAETASRIQTILSETAISTQDIDAVVESVAARARAEFPDATVTTTVDPAPVLATDSLEHALWELVENACIHTHDNPTVEITVDERGQNTVVQVVDDGPGIPEKERAVISLDQETPLQHGTGLGLWLVRWVLELSGGDIDFEHEPNTVVTVTLPQPDGSER